MDFGKEIVMLQNERQKCISAMDFEKAREIENHIQQLRSGAMACANQDKSRSQKSNFEYEKHAALSELAQVVSVLTRRIYQIRGKYQRDLVTVQARHAKEMTDLSAEYAKEIELAALRPVPQATIIERDAQNQAQRSNYTMAQCMMREAEQVRGQFLESLKADLNKKYSGLQNKMMKRHELFMKSFNSKLDTDIQQVRLDYRAAVNVAKRRLSLTSIKNGVKLTEDEIEKMIAKYPLLDDEVPPPEPSPKHVGPPSPRLFDPRGYPISSGSSQASEVTPRTKAARKGARATPVSK